MLCQDCKKGRWKIEQGAPESLVTASFEDQFIIPKRAKTCNVIPASKSTPREHSADYATVNNY